MDRRRVIIDCDPGIDDCFALALCLEHLDVAGITTVAGNAELSCTQKNARYVCQLTGHPEVKVYAGCDAPLSGELICAPEIHGNNGLGDLQIQEPEVALEDENAVDYLIRAFREDPGICLVTLGPLTNVAKALLDAPDLKDRIPEIYCMGGSAFCGNVTAVGEFNFYTDPEAAKIVLEAGIQIRMVGLNVTRQVRVGQEEVALVRAAGGATAEFFADIMDYIAVRDGQICDACLVAWLIEPDLITESAMIEAKIETKGEFTRGMMVCDWRNFMGTSSKIDLEHGRVSGFREEAEANVDMALAIDAEAFKKLLIRTLNEICA